jgi:hypothetical protein
VVNLTCPAAGVLQVLYEDSAPRLWWLPAALAPATAPGMGGRGCGQPSGVGLLWQTHKGQLDFSAPTGEAVLRVWLSAEQQHGYLSCFGVLFCMKQSVSVWRSQQCLHYGVGNVAKRTRVPQGVLQHLLYLLTHTPAPPQVW